MTSDQTLQSNVRVQAVVSREIAERLKRSAELEDRLQLREARHR